MRSRHRSARAPDRYQRSGIMPVSFSFVCPNSTPATGSRKVNNSQKPIAKWGVHTYRYHRVQHCTRGHCQCGRARSRLLAGNIATPSGRRSTPQSGRSKSPMAHLASSSGSVTERADFGTSLRAERERAGITLDAIAASTKIKRSLLAGLENNDLSHWPAGIFRRGFFRAYLDAVGLPSERLVADFVRLFPDSASVCASDLKAFDASEGGLRLTLAETRSSRVQVVLHQTAAATSDLVAVVALTAAAVGLLGWSFWPTVGTVALTYFFTSVACLGRTPGLWWLSSDRTARRRTAVRATTGGPLLRIVVRQPDSLRSRPSDAETSVA